MSLNRSHKAGLFLTVIVLAACLLLDASIQTTLGIALVAALSWRLGSTSAKNPAILLAENITMAENITEAIKEEVAARLAERKVKIDPAFQELDNFVDSNTRPPSRRDLFDDMAEVYIPYGVEPVVEAAIAKRVVVDGTIPFSRLRQLPPELSSLAKLAKCENYEPSRGGDLYDLADRVEARVKQLADTAGALGNYESLQGEWKGYLTDIKDLEALTKAPSLDAKITALRDPNVGMALIRHGVSTKPFWEAEMNGVNGRVLVFLSLLRKRSKGRPTGFS